MAELDRKVELLQHQSKSLQIGRTGHWSVPSSTVSGDSTHWTVQAADSDRTGQTRNGYRTRTGVVIATLYCSELGRQSPRRIDDVVERSCWPRIC